MGKYTVDDVDKELSYGGPRDSHTRELLFELRSALTSKAFFESQVQELLARLEATQALVPGFEVLDLRVDALDALDVTGVPPSLPFAVRRVGSSTLEGSFATFERASEEAAKLTAVLLP